MSENDPHQHDDEFRTKLTFAVKDGAEVKEIVSTLRDNGYEIEKHTRKHDSNSHEWVYSHSIKPATDTDREDYQ